MPIELDDLAPLLRRVSMFSRCTDGECRQIARHAEFREVPKGARLITKGDEGSDLFVLLTGTADAEVDGDVVDRSTWVTTSASWPRWRLRPEPATWSPRIGARSQC